MLNGYGAGVDSWFLPIGGSDNTFLGGRMMPEDKEYWFIWGGDWVMIKRELLGDFLRKWKEHRFGKPVENKKLDKKGKK